MRSLESFFTYVSEPVNLSFSLPPPFLPPPACVCGLHTIFCFGQAASKLFRGLPPPISKEAAAEEAKAKSRGLESKKKKKLAINSIVPYKAGQKILLVGEGNFSFAAALAAKLGTANDILATSFDRKEQLRVKYLDSEEYEDEVVGYGGEVLHGIDATRLREHAGLDMPYDCVVFNFPHVGAGIKDQLLNIRANQTMLSAFIRSALEALHNEGEVHITLKKGEPYDSWRLVKLGMEIPGVRLKNAFDFDPKLYPTYRHRRTLGHAAGISAEENEDIIPSGAKTFVFARGPSQAGQQQATQPQRKQVTKAAHGKKQRGGKRKGSSSAAGAQAGKKARVGKRERIKANA